MLSKNNEVRLQVGHSVFVYKTHAYQILEYMLFKCFLC